MKTHSIILYMLLCVFCCEYANGVLQDKLVGLMENRHTINIGVIVDMNSFLGKVVESCIKMAIKDFYNDNSQYTTRISVQIRDSMGDSFRSTAAALDLLETAKVHALFVPVVSTEELFMASLADKYNVPLLSFSPISSFGKHPYYLQVAGDETTEFRGIAALHTLFKWKHCAILHEDERQVPPGLYSILLENNIGVKYHAPISSGGATNKQIVDKLRVIMKARTSIIILHLSPSLASQVFINAKMLGMMSKGFAWIVTSKTMNLLSSHDSSAYELMQGVLGFRSYFSASNKLQNLTLRWRRDFHLPEMETRELNVYGILAYDTLWALAHAIVRVGIKQNQNRVRCKLLDPVCVRVSDRGQALLTQIVTNKFIGLAGEFELKNGKPIHGTYEVVNVIGNGERRVGYWNVASGLTKEIYPPNNNSANSSFDLETIIWPGISTTTPAGASQLVPISGKSFRVVIPSEMTWPELVNWRYENQTNVTIADGFCIEVFRAAFDWLQYDISFEFFPFFNGSYDDLIYQVHQQNFDAAAGHITILAKRSEYVDFTCPYTELGIGMVAKLDDKDPWFFTKPLDQGLWIICAIWFVVMGIIVWIIERPINEEFQGSLVQQVGTLLWFAVSTLVFAQRERLQSNLSRFVVGIWLFVVLILTSSYTASLSSLLTVQKFKLTKSDYIGFNTITKSDVARNHNFMDSRRPFNTAEEYDEALRRGSKNGGIDFIVKEIPYIKVFLGKYPNEYALVQTSIKTNGFGFAFPKGSPLVLELSRAISGLREDGKLQEIEKKWFTGQPPALSQGNQPPSINALSIRNFYGLFLISGISIVVAGVLLLLIFLRGKMFTLRVLAAQRLLLLFRRFHPRMIIR